MIKKIFSPILLLTLLIFFLNNCGIYKRSDVKDNPVEVHKRVQKNIEEGKSSGVPKEEGRYFKQGLPNDGYLSFDLDKDYLKRFSDALWFPPYKPARFKSNGKEYFVKILKVDDNKIKCEIYDEDTNF